MKLSERIQAAAEPTDCLKLDVDVLGMFIAQQIIDAISYLERLPEDIDLDAVTREVFHEHVRHVTYLAVPPGVADEVQPVLAGASADSLRRFDAVGEQLLPGLLWIQSMVVAGDADVPNRYSALHASLTERANAMLLGSTLKDALHLVADSLFLRAVSARDLRVVWFRNGMSFSGTLDAIERARGAGVLAFNRARRTVCRS